jgi:hypothetical protein
MTPSFAVLAEPNSVPRVGIILQIYRISAIVFHIDGIQQDVAMGPFVRPEALSMQPDERVKNLKNFLLFSTVTH